MDTVLPECQRLPSWPRDAAGSLQLEEPLPLPGEILKFLGTAALVAVTGLLLLMAG